jgi:prepilin-type N-terminal cleavage/methylation domain-containing protein/prepilin-type processing-associated H-X9-DG protein
MNVAQREREAFTLIELLVVIGIVGVLIVLLLPAVQRAREAVRRVHCCNNLMQFGLALKSYENAHKVLPPGVVNPSGPIKNEANEYHVSWLVQILPFVDLDEFYDAFNFAAGAYGGANSTARAMEIKFFLCPSDARAAGPDLHTNYAGCHHDTEAPIDSNNQGVLYLNSAIRFNDIPDGTSNTIFVGEKMITTPDFGWASGTRSALRNTGTLPNQAVIRAGDSVGGFSSQHAGVANFSFGDGSVRFLKSSINAQVYRLLGNRADGEMVSANEF